MEFEEFAPFTKRLMALLSDDDYTELQILLMEQPEAGKVIPNRRACAKSDALPKGTANAAEHG